ncbi:putative high-affinity zinc uptake system protein [Dinoroseobacter shibae DFL 12 = DSM 16493]|jgi:zinc transport system substrate-binding protein|uniref:High-affinity zinc uptake system protein ZnuA n=1 Tax=Dinoroseobacter shibae (strain DSM 16493 / NCIMB 14021 / DFL 12) TaxID=398580 RepID=A8LLR8_DINSH|nr:zinc ABC transporter substrate-binding protein [Dinoroseobacter shibae]ABV93446.1 putative high-affinity zinc uptake system protein [Dinoroseobacter shibae DFL 12 = DSM 16493]URF48359.1 zinc ABC transporter substrate-binding protein [Dinoroseobacter shibae]URF52669.1 zinc ABC transporter substrate-binding protein [Dinoroseobacter shibae]
MSRNLTTLCVATTLLGGTALADVPTVATDIAPVHALVARVMDGVGTPTLILPPGASPHEYSLRPSEAAALQDADLVFWMGADLAPWMEDAVATLATNARVTTLLDAEETTLLPFREGALFEAHDHDHGDEEHDHASHDHDHDHDHAEHDNAHDHDHDHTHDSSEKAASHDHAHDDHDHETHAGHDHGEHDPHAWLSPQNAAAWLTLIATQLSTADPDNAATYFTNATEGRTELDALSAEVAEILAPARGGSFIVFHDAYQYFETAFDFPASGAISLSDATDPSPARIAEIRDRVRDEGITCVLAEPQFNAGLVDTVLDGTEARTGVIDPIGIDLTPGPDLYPQLIRNMATTLAGCL